MSEYTPGQGRRRLSDIVERLRASSRGLCSEDPADYWAARITVADALEAAEEIERLRKEIRAAIGYMLNAQIDLETGATKATAVTTIKGGVKRARAALAKAEGGRNA